ncbi:VWA domain-containing protein [Williamsia sp. DF01-3]|uniref:vWA domain-containing protein n=1 Tax=Williamsia sp. DF01-3 TaxID=2934157 RepID=UPI001FF1A4D7|nr:VWA domain-containing protein [Williamsia sp. DF01-3]MCK0519287.1 VWA domain-containing protein [Williamsia sp. DF01-3]
MVTLSRGANTTISSGVLTVAVTGAAPGTVDVMAFLLGDNHKTRTDSDFIFFNQPQSVDGAVVLSGGTTLTVDLARVPADVHTVAVAVACDEGYPSPLSALPALAASASGTGFQIELPAAGLSTERAAVLSEIYRRGGEWKIRNVSAGWDRGFADLVREHGVEVDDEPAATSPAPEVPAVRSVAGEEKLSLEKRQRLDMRKREVHKVLLSKNATGVRARVILVIDKTGSMSRQYSSRVVHRVVERMLAVATQIDDDGQLEPYMYARGFARVPDISVTNVESWTEEFLHLSGVHGGIDYDAIGASNDELPIMNEILNTVVPGRPVLVLFFTDGGFRKKGPISELMRAASSAPVFWQFVGIGRANYGVLERLDDMEGRVVDNAGFFALDDIDQVSDDDLYQRLLSEFPDWMRAAKTASILP